MAAIEGSIAGKRCLIVDDQFLIAMDIRQIVEAAGAHSVVCVASAEEALAAIDGAPFDLAILDVKLGGMLRTSLSVAARLSADDTPFVFLTGMRSDDPLFREFPDVPVVEKPYDVTALLAALRRAIERQEGLGPTRPPRAS
ncbi:MAG: response regulator [Pseudolabrys sp.]